MERAWNLIVAEHWDTFKDGDMHMGFFHLNILISIGLRLIAQKGELKVYLFDSETMLSMFLVYRRCRRRVVGSEIR